MTRETTTPTTMPNPKPNRRRRLVAHALAVLGATSSLLIVPTTGTAAAAESNCPSAGATVTCTFSYTGAEQTFTVPAGVSAVQVTTVGAPGGANTKTYAGSTVVPGGAGAVATGAVPVTAAQVLYVHVGGAGGHQTDRAYNGGGSSSFFAGGGGGASDVRFTPESGDVYRPAVVAGGGGGAGTGGFINDKDDVHSFADYPPGGAGGAAGPDGGVSPTLFAGFIITGNGGAGGGGTSDRAGSGGGSVLGGHAGAAGFVIDGGGGGFASVHSGGGGAAAAA